MVEQFIPNIKTGHCDGTPPPIGKVISIPDGEWIGPEGKFVPNGNIFTGSVIIRGRNFIKICLSQSKENCAQCSCPPDYCGAPLK